jgi:hypothetical protein
MESVLCQTKFNGLEGECGISVYIADLPPDEDLEIYIKIKDDLIFAYRDLDDSTRTATIDFRNLKHQQCYHVECYITSINESICLESIMYAHQVSYKNAIQNARPVTMRFNKELHRRDLNGNNYMHKQKS